MFISVQLSSLAVRIAGVSAVTIVSPAGRLLFHASRSTGLSKQSLVLPDVVIYIYSVNGGLFLMKVPEYRIHTVSWGITALLRASRS